MALIPRLFRENHLKRHTGVGSGFLKTPVTGHITFLSHINDALEEFQEEESLYSTNTILFVPEGCCVLRIQSAICTHVPGDDVNT